MPISREDFEEILCACVRKSVRTRSGNERVIDLNHLEQVLDRYTKAKPKLTVERVKGMIKKLHDAGLARDECPTCKTDSHRAYRFALDELANEIERAEND